jgi:hypothetical protein
MKVARTVLRGESAGNGSLLPDSVSIALTAFMRV